MLKEHKIVTDNEELIKEAIENKAIDPVVINMLNELSADKQDAKRAENLLKLYCDKCLHQKIKHDLLVEYDQKTLSKTSIISSIFRKELNIQEKNSILENARMAERHETGKLTGEYKPGLRMRMVAFLTGKAIKKLPTMDQIHEAAIVYNKERDNENFRKTIKVLTQEQKEEYRQLSEKEATTLTEDEKGKLEYYKGVKDNTRKYRDTKNEIYHEKENFDDETRREYRSVKTAQTKQEEKQGTER